MNLHHRLEGPADAPVVVLSSALGTTLELWDRQVPALTRSFRLLRYDHRGHGRSEAPPGPYTVEQLARDLLRTLDRLEVERVSLCGLSLGGAVAMWTAVYAPERIDRLVLACTSARFGTPELWAERAEIVRAEGFDPIVDVLLGRWFTAQAQPQVVASFREMLVSTPPEGYAACCDALAAWDFRDRLGSIQAPTLVLAGAEDIATPPEHARLIGEGVPGARIVVLPNAAHLANVEQPEPFARAVLDHLTASTEEAA